MFRSSLSAHAVHNVSVDHHGARAKRRFVHPVRPGNTCARGRDSDSQTAVQSLWLVLYQNCSKKLRI